MKALLNMLQQRPEVEALEILNRIRLSCDPFTVLRDTREADFILPNSALSAHNPENDILKH
jgi:hypothetical protein